MVNPNSLINYRLLGHISAGAHGHVVRATLIDKDENDVDSLLAIKRIFVRPQTSSLLNVLREIKCLQLLQPHNYITKLLKVFIRGSTINMVFPLYPANLTTLIYDMNLNFYQKTAYTYMLLNALEHIHSNHILHRDLKPNNILINWNGELLIGDFGQARPLYIEQDLDQYSINDSKNLKKKNQDLLSHQVCTRWYRAPELLYGSRNYDFSIDIWSFGCIVAEIFQSRPLFAGGSDIEQLCIVTSALGEPPFFWAQNMPDYDKIIFDKNDNQKNKFNCYDNLKLKVNNDDVIDLIRSVLKYTQREKPKILLNNHNLFNEIRQKGILINELVKLSHVKQLSGPKKKNNLNK